MSELKPLILLPLPEGHVLRKEVDWIWNQYRFLKANASAGLVVDDRDRAYTTYEHWPEGVECPWVVRIKDEPVRRDGGEGPDEPGEGWRFLALGEILIEGDQYWACGEEDLSGNWWVNHIQVSRPKYRRRVEPTVPGDPSEGFRWPKPPVDIPPKPLVDTRQGPDEPGEGWRFLALEEQPIEGDEYWSHGVWSPSNNWRSNHEQSPTQKYRRRDIPVFNPETFTSDYGPYPQQPPMGPVERSAVIGYRTLKAQCERQAAAIERLEKAYDSSRATIVVYEQGVKKIYNTLNDVSPDWHRHDGHAYDDACNAIRKQWKEAKQRDQLRYENLTAVGDAFAEAGVTWTTPRKGQEVAYVCEKIKQLAANQTKLEALGLQAAEYKARCEQLQASETKLRTQIERQVVAIVELLAAKYRDRCEQQPLRWERRVPTEEEMRNRHYLTRHLVVGVTMCEPGERTEASTCWTEVCILPDILPAMDEPKTDDGAAVVYEICSDDFVLD